MVTSNLLPLRQMFTFLQRLKPEIKLLVLVVSNLVVMPLNTSFVVQVWYKWVLPFKKKVSLFFDRITKELKEIMEEKGYETLEEDFRGKLHYID